MGDHDLFLGDCLQGLATLASKSVDHVITDPPYSEHVHKNLGREARNDGSANRDALSFVCLTSGLADQIAAEACRVGRRWFLFLCDERAIGMWISGIEKAGGEVVRCGAWVKRDPMPQMSGDRPAAGTESIVIGHAPRSAGPMKWNGGGRPAVWHHSVKVDGDRVHPAQKPLPLMEDLVRDFTDSGDLICDPFAGSGTTGVACKRLGRRFVGWEKDEVFWGRAVRRLEETRQQYELLPRSPKAKQTRLLP